jgi:hypothetical protein
MSGAVYTCPTCGREVVGLITPAHEYLCTGAPGHGHVPVPVSRLEDRVPEDAVSAPEGK